MSNTNCKNIENNNSCDFCDFCYSCNGLRMSIAKWVETKDMTDSEKSNWSSHKQTGDFLKTLSYHDAWKELWDGLSQEDKNFLTTLPHFNADIFEKITGIKIDDKKSELLKKADELVQKANELKAEAEKM